MTMYAYAPAPDVLIKIYKISLFEPKVMVNFRSFVAKEGTHPSATEGLEMYQSSS